MPDIILYEKEFFPHVNPIINNKTRFHVLRKNSRSYTENKQAKMTVAISISKTIRVHSVKVSSVDKILRLTR